MSCDGETPLHIASMLGHAEFVQELLGPKPELAEELDSFIKGHVNFLKEFVKVRPKAVRMLIERGETISGMRFDQLEAMKFLLEQMSDHEFVN
ncbi:hypothetical protein Patl1_14525 [Pistacia atlantica]|uniref:Uncharacterized protein n=1 Tax=Pistacia atlantica TaxID=434234 RepID=A0ACC1AVP1_9ROSI|nr:hypothetical protein Patl1_14525 [Pistacia atlantica]